METAETQLKTELGIIQEVRIRGLPMGRNSLVCHCRGGSLGGPTVDRQEFGFESSTVSSIDFPAAATRDGAP